VYLNLIITSLETPVLGWAFRMTCPCTTLTSQLLIGKKWTEAPGYKAHWSQAISPLCDSIFW
jgi:hypothetical protein